MAVSAHAVLAALRARRPEIGTKKAHKLLYYCQGHHLAAFGTVLFRERISAWDMGPVVGEVWHAEKNDKPIDIDPIGDEAQLNTVGYVLSRYGSLSGDELERLTHSESPWLRADEHRAPGTSEPIPPEWIEEFFGQDADDDDDNLPRLPSKDVADLVAGAAERRAQIGDEDDPAEIRRRLDDLRPRTESRAG